MGIPVFNATGLSLYGTKFRVTRLKHASVYSEGSTRVRIHKATGNLIAVKDLKRFDGICTIKFEVGEIPQVF